MIGEYKINRTTRRCSVGNRNLEPGEYYYSVVTENDEEFKRVDIAADAWTGPPENCIGHWKNRVPMPEEKKRELAPPEVLIDLLRSMTEPSQTKMRFLLALMLLRKRSLKPVETTTLISSQRNHEPEPTEAIELAVDETMELESTLDGSVISIVVADIAAGEAESLQAELIDMLYRDTE